MLGGDRRSSGRQRRSLDLSLVGRQRRRPLVPEQSLGVRRVTGDAPCRCESARARRHRCRRLRPDRPLLVLSVSRSGRAARAGCRRRPGVHDHGWADVRRRTAQLLLHPAAGPCRSPAPRPTGRACAAHRQRRLLHEAFDAHAGRRAADRGVPLRLGSGRRRRVADAPDTRPSPQPRRRSRPTR